MLQITIPDSELWDEIKQEFVYVKGQTIQMEHSLVSLSKWESKWNKPFLTKENKTFEESLDYVKCMTITQNVKDELYNSLTRENVEDINKYIDAKMTATMFSRNLKAPKNNEQITAELIYYWMIALNIPMECQKWHVNRLFTLVKVCNIKNETPKKMSQREIMSQNAALNAARRKRLHTNG